jgi:hypothetical protein
VEPGPKELPERNPALVLRLKAIRDRPMRVAVLVEEMRAPAARVIPKLSRFIDYAHVEDAHAVALDALALTLTETDRVSYETRVELYQAAVTAGDPVLALLILDVELANQEATKLEKEVSKERPLIPRGRALTLGERKSLARGPRKEALLNLMRDPHPEVVRNLLENPYVIEKDIVRIAARRPTLAETQRVIFLSHKWISRYRIKRSLALNPNTPVPLAARLMPALRDGDLKMIAEDRHFPSALRLHGRQIIERRQRIAAITSRIALPPPTSAPPPEQTN